MNQEQKILHLTLKKKWFDMIANGEKKEEYREIKWYWFKRLVFQPEKVLSYWSVLEMQPTVERKIQLLKEHESFWKMIAFNPLDIVSANNGYAKNCPNVQWTHKGIRIGKPNPAWCEPEDVNKTLFILEIGSLLNQKEVSNG